MYNAEVLSKFPVVQHFPFGSLFQFEQDPSAPPIITSIHTESQPSSHSISVSGNTEGAPTSRLATAPEATKAPWALTGKTPDMARPLQEGTKAPWAAKSNLPTTSAPWAKAPSSPSPGMMPPTIAPWAAGSQPTTGSPDRNLANKQ